MARIGTYPPDGSVTGTEQIISTNTDGSTKNITPDQLADHSSDNNKYYKIPLQTTVLLSALAELSLTDKARVYVEDELADYFYDAQAVSGDVTPDDQTGGTGFWIKSASSVTTIVGITGTKAQYNTSVTDGNFMYIGDAPTSHTHVIADITDITGTPTGSKFLRDDGVWTAVGGGGDALVANPLSQFAATTSLQLKGVISDETGSGALVFATTPTLVTPVLGVATATSINGATVPSVSDTLVGKATTDTLTNKTFDANGTGNNISNIDVADLANGTDGELITWSATGVAATVAVGTATHVLTSNGVGVAPTFQAAAGGGGTEFQVYEYGFDFNTTGTTTFYGIQEGFITATINLGTQAASAITAANFLLCRPAGFSDGAQTVVSFDFFTGDSVNPLEVTIIGATFTTGGALNSLTVYLEKTLSTTDYGFSNIVIGDFLDTTIPDGETIYIFYRTADVGHISYRLKCSID